MTQSGRFCLHLLHQNQLALVQKLGFESGRETNKLKNVEYSLTESNLPLLSNSAAYFDCEIINAMDAGPSTFFMGQVRASGRHDEFDSLTLMTSDYLRNQLSDEWKELYRQNKRDVQEWARQHLEVDPSYEWDSK
jgi:flavin reductase (DIM6/NTAB) family NADH-FMN oxidoreductase RutF